MRLVGYKLRTVLIIMILAFVFITTLGILRIANNHNEVARWGDLNHSVHFGETTVVICQGAIINYNPAIYGRLGGPFPHLLEIVPKVRDKLNRLLYFLKPCPVTPKQSQIQISVQILFRPETGKPDFEFTLEKIKNSSKYSLWGENVIFRDMWFTGVDWNKNDFLLSITDRKTGKKQFVHIQPAEWKISKYHLGDLRAPYPPEGAPVVPISSGFLETFQADLDENGKFPGWKKYILPEVINTFPSNRMRVWQNGRQLYPCNIGRCSWEGTRPGFDYVYAYTLAYCDSESRDSNLRQKLYFVRWQNSWRVLDVGPVQSLIRDKTEKTDLWGKQ